MSADSLPKIVIIILNWNGKQDTLECLHSLANVSYPCFEIILVDNGSSDDSIAAFQKEFASIRLLETGENLGFAGGNNVGIQDALLRKPDLILLLNNDTIVDPGFLHAFAAHFQNNPALGISGAKTYLYAHPTQFDHFGGIWNPKKANFDLIGNRLIDDGKSWEAPQEIDYVCGCALIARREVFETIGLLEPKFFLIWEESDFCFRAKRAGFSILTSPQAKIWHKVSASFTGKPHSTYFWWRNRLLWIERNCSFSQKCALFYKVLIPEIFKLWKHKLLKSLQYRLFPSTKQQERLEKLAICRAALQGVKDYLLRRFGNAPSWIYSFKE